MSIEESAKKLAEALLKRGLPKEQVNKIVEKYVVGMRRIREGKPKLELANKPKGSGVWTKEKVRKRVEEMRKRNVGY